MTQLLQQPDPDIEFKLMKVRLAYELLTGRHVVPTTTWRWCTRGCHGVVLESWMVGCERLTHVAAMRKFIEAISLPKSAREAIAKANETRVVPPLDERTRARLKEEFGVEVEHANL